MCISRESVDLRLILDALFKNILSSTNLIEYKMQLKYITLIFILGAICMSQVACKKDNKTQPISTEHTIPPASAPATISTPSKTEIAPPPDFKLRDEKFHTMNIICESSEMDIIDSLILFIYRFNAANYPDKDFSVAHSQLFYTSEQRRISISSFEDKLIAMRYYDEIMSELLSTPEYDTITDRAYIIHGSNERLLTRDEETWKSYYNFFTQEYLNSKADTLRNNFDTATLYSAKDTIGFIVCIQTQKQDSLSEATAKSNLMEITESHFPNMDLKVRLYSYREQKQNTLYSIWSFDRESEAIQCRNHIMEKFPELKSDIFYITMNNYLTMSREGNTEDYMAFYDATYR